MGEKKQSLQILIITGLSGAGKTQVINCLEDIGYYCVDNLPPVLLKKFLELGFQSQNWVSHVALVIDVRGGDFFSDINQALNELRSENIQFEILFLEASDDALVRRFKESRRRHPLSAGSLLEAIQSERNILLDLKTSANIIIDTSNLSVRQLNEKIKELFGSNETNDFVLNVVSFGYKLGIPMDADVIIDLRFLPNPFYDPKMKTMTGEDQDVIDFVLGSPITQRFLKYFMDLYIFLIPNYIKEGKSSLTLAIGCTGGQHRSVVMASFCGEEFKRLGYNTNVKHRDIQKYKAVYKEK